MLAKLAVSKIYMKNKDSGRACVILQKNKKAEEPLFPGIKMNNKYIIIW